MRFLLIVLSSFLLGACVAGHNFNYDKTAQIELHQLKSTEYTNLFGKPFKTTEMTTGDGKFKHVLFHNLSKSFFGEVSLRNLILEFKNDQLNAYVYVSSYDIDKTRVFLSKVDQIKIGTSTKNDILVLMNKPYGKALCPSLLKDYKERCAKHKEIWSWVEYDKTRTFNNAGLLGKAIFIIFDDNDKVIDFESVDNK